MAVSVPMVAVTRAPSAVGVELAIIDKVPVPAPTVLDAVHVLSSTFIASPPKWSVQPVLFPVRLAAVRVCPPNVNVSEVSSLVKLSPAGRSNAVILN